MRNALEETKILFLNIELNYRWFDPYNYVNDDVDQDGELDGEP